MSITVAALSRSGRSRGSSEIGAERLAVLLGSVSDSESRTWDRAMMARVRAGDDVAFAAIFDRYGGIVNGIAVRLTGADHGADVTQDVFFQLWQHPERFDPDIGGLASYLAVASRRRAIDALRSRQRRQARERRVTETESTTPGGSVEGEVFASLAAQEVRAAIDELPRDQRRAIELAYLDGLTYRQVAAATRTSEGTAKSRLRLGLARLARELGTVSDTEQERAWN